jgi:hypothetical protein
MPAYAYLIDHTGGVWVLADFDANGFPRYSTPGELGDPDIPGEDRDKGIRENLIDDLYGISECGPTVVPLNTPESERLDQWERTHTFVNVP